MTMERDRVAVYCRISHDRAGAGLGVERQERECRELAQRIGWNVVAVFTDNNVSAYKTRRARPGYQELLGAIKNDEINGLLVWHTDRLHRSVRELLDFLDLIKNKDFPVRTVQAGQIDLATPTGRALAVTFGAWAQQESEHKAERIRSKARELAEAGKVGGGGSRPFGYEPDRRTVRESEAELIAEAARRILAGVDTIHGIVREWNERGVRTVSGTRWSPHVVRRLLMSARISGRRSHHGVIVADAEWGAIITPEDSDKLRELLSDPARTTNPAGNARKYLLSGMLFCGLCGRRMLARPQGDRKRSYVCADVGMAHLRVIAEPLELYVREAAFDYLSEFTELAAALRRPAEADGSERLREARLWSELRNYQASLEDVESRFYVHRKMPEATFERVRRELEANIDGVKTQLGRMREAAVVLSMPTTADAARTWWDERSLHWRRQLVSLLVERVTIGPGVRGRNTFDPGRVAVTWRKPY